MNQQPYQTPPQWWSPQPSPTWMRFWRHWRKRRGYRQHALCDVEVRGIEHVEDALEREGGTLITPNHCSHADPFVLLEAVDQLQAPMYFMTAWQVFAQTHSVGRQVLRQHGCFSINREGNDVRAVRQAVRVLQNDEAPLVIFPEGEVFHMNDRVTPFRKGAVQTAVWAARRSRQSVSIVPCGIKYRFIDDPTPALNAELVRLEQEVGCPDSLGQPLVERIRRFGEFMLSEKERELIGSPQSGTLGKRVGRLIETILRPMENRYRVSSCEGTIPERVKRLRYRAIWMLETPALANAANHSKADLQKDLQRLFLATQLFSYRVNYLAGDPPVERLAETVEKFVEDVFGLHRATPPAERRAIVEFDCPLMIDPEAANRDRVPALTHRLQQRVQEVIDEINRSFQPAPLNSGTSWSTASLVPAA